jgi:hypothetical protein
MLMPLIKVCLSKKEEDLWAAELSNIFAGVIPP